MYGTGSPQRFERPKNVSGQGASNFQIQIITSCAFEPWVNSSDIFLNPINHKILNTAWHPNQEEAGFEICLATSSREINVSKMRQVVNEF